MVNNSVAVFSLRRMIGLIKSAAYAKAAFRHTTLVRPPFSENHVWNAIIGAITGEYGFAEIGMDVKAIDAEQERVAEGLLDGALRAMTLGPIKFVDYLAQMESARQADLANMQIVYSSALRISKGIAGDLETAVKTCAIIKFGSTLVVAATPVGLTLAGVGATAGGLATIGATGWVAFGFSVTKSLAKDMSQARNSGIIAFDNSYKEDPKHIVKKVGDKVAEKAADKLENKILTQEGLIETAERKIIELSRSVARTVSARKLAKVGRRVAEAESSIANASRSINLATAGRATARLFQIAFAAHDVYEGWEDLEAEWGVPKRPE